MRKHRAIIVTILIFLAVLAAAALTYYKRKFPYGYSHCCIISMQLALWSYAEDHGGRFPAGESSPEASLSLLYRTEYIRDPDILRGMTVPEETARRILERGGLLGPDNCGWHYVEGLTQADDERIALLWPKVALGHNGQRTKDNGRQVIVVGGGGEWIPGDKWAPFLKEQKQLLAARNTKANKTHITH